jgi:hypothetical protein
MYQRIERCRICGNPRLEPVLDLGEQALTGVFPRRRGAPVTAGPLRLVRCAGGGEACGLLQLEHTYDLSEMYGENYGYRSGLNPSMVDHLRRKVSRILGQVTLGPGDLVVDIGSNDSTALRAYPAGPLRVGIDPTGAKFRSFYPPEVALIPEFFSSALLRDLYPGKRARVVTSFSMFYDLPDPVAFMGEVRDVLADDGIWVFEQSYMPTMLEKHSYDTVCHEHLEFYALRQIHWMAGRVGLEVLDVELNDVNGGSFSVTAARTGSGRKASPSVLGLVAREARAGLDGPGPYHAFARATAEARRELLDFLGDARARGKTVAALGASTKGNVILQYCGLTEREISCIGEVNPDKFGCFTPGGEIPIVPEEELLARNPDYLVVLPWHFRRFFESNPRYAGRNLVFPLPRLEVVATRPA